MTSLKTGWMAPRFSLMSLNRINVFHEININEMIDPVGHSVWSAPYHLNISAVSVHFH